MAAHPLTLQAIARRNRSSAANFAETIVRPRSGSAPSTIASRRSSVSESQTRTLAAPITRIEYVMKNSLWGQENRSSSHGVRRMTNMYAPMESIAMNAGGSVTSTSTEMSACRSSIADDTSSLSKNRSKNVRTSSRNWLTAASRFHRVEQRARPRLGVLFGYDAREHRIERRQVQQLSKVLDRVGADRAALLQNHDARAGLLDHLEDV